MVYFVYFLLFSLPSCVYLFFKLSGCILTQSSTAEFLHRLMFKRIANSGIHLYNFFAFVTLSFDKSSQRNLLGKEIIMRIDFLWIQFQESLSFFFRIRCVMLSFNVQHSKKIVLFINENQPCINSHRVTELRLLQLELTMFFILQLNNL